MVATPAAAAAARVAARLAEGATAGRRRLSTASNGGGVAPGARVAAGAVDAGNPSTRTPARGGQVADRRTMPADVFDFGASLRAGSAPPPPPPTGPLPDGTPGAPGAAAVRSRLVEALCSEWSRRVDGVRAPQEIVAALAAMRPDEATNPAPEPGSRAPEPAASTPGSGAREPAASTRTPRPEPPGGRADRERPIASGFVAVPRTGSIVPPEVAARGDVPPNASHPAAGPAAPTVAFPAMPPDALEELDDLAERVGLILREEARRNGIDV
jgi:hypothetical protein